MWSPARREFYNKDRSRGEFFLAIDILCIESLVGFKWVGLGHWCGTCGMFSVWLVWVQN